MYLITRPAVPNSNGRDRLDGTFSGRVASSRQGRLVPQMQVSMLQMEQSTSGSLFDSHGSFNGPVVSIDLVLPGTYSNYLTPHSLMDPSGRTKKNGAWISRIPAVEEGYARIYAAMGCVYGRYGKMLRLENSSSHEGFSFFYDVTLTPSSTCLE